MIGTMLRVSGVSSLGTTQRCVSVHWCFHHQDRYSGGQETVGWTVTHVQLITIWNIDAGWKQSQTLLDDCICSLCRSSWLSRDGMLSVCTEVQWLQLFALFFRYLQAIQYGTEDNSTAVVVPFGAWGKYKNSEINFSFSRSFASSGRWAWSPAWTQCSYAAMYQWAYQETGNTQKDTCTRVSLWSDRSQCSVSLPAMYTVVFS